MAYVIAAPEMMTSAAGDLATIGSDLSAAHMAAAPPTVALVPAAADEVSAGVAHLFSRYAEDYHALAGKAAAFNDQFVQTLKSGGAAYAQTEAYAGGLLSALLPPGILNLVNAVLNSVAGLLPPPPPLGSLNLVSALALVPLFLIFFGPYVLAVAFGILVIEAQALLMQLLMMLGL